MSFLQQIKAKEGLSVSYTVFFYRIKNQLLLSWHSKLIKQWLGLLSRSRRFVVKPAFFEEMCISLVKVYKCIPFFQKETVLLSLSCPSLLVFLDIFLLLLSIFHLPTYSTQPFNMCLYPSHILSFPLCFSSQTKELGQYFDCSGGFQVSGGGPVWSGRWKASCHDQMARICGR